MANSTGSRAQVTVEMLVILVVLFGLLTIAFFLFATQQSAAQETEQAHAARRTAELVAQHATYAREGPIGGHVRVFIPPATQPQIIYLRDGFVEVRSGQTLVTAPLSMGGLSAGPFSDGNVLVFGRNTNGITVTQT